MLKKFIFLVPLFLNGMEMRQIDEDREGDQVTILDQARFAASLAALRLRHNWDKIAYPWWASISDDVAIGGMPMKNCGHVEDIIAWSQTTGKKLAVLSLIYAHEESRVLFVGTPMQEEDFAKRKIERTVVPAKDWDGLSREQFKKALEILQKNKFANKATLVHCKGGAGRSPSAVIAHLVMQDESKVGIGNLNYNTTREQAAEVFKTYHGRLKKLWPNIKMNTEQRKSAEDFLFHLCGDEQGRAWLKRYKVGSKEVAKTEEVGD